MARVNMNKTGLVSAVTNALDENGIRKHVQDLKIPLRVIDEEDHEAVFTIRKAAKSLKLTNEDVESVLLVLAEVIKASIQVGEPVSWPGIGKLGLEYKKPHIRKMPQDDEPREIQGHYILKFSPAKELKGRVKVFQHSLSDGTFDEYLNQLHEKRGDELDGN